MNCANGFCCLCACCFAVMMLARTVINDDFIITIEASLRVNLEAVWLNAD